MAAKVAMVAVPTVLGIASIRVYTISDTPSDGLLTRKRLNIYTPLQSAQVNFVPESPGVIESGVTTAREGILPVFHAIQGACGSVKTGTLNIYHAGEDVYYYLKDPPPGFLPRVGTISMAGILGMFLARKGSRFKRLALPLGLTCAGASVCYPAQAVAVCKMTGKKGYAAGLWSITSMSSLFTSTEPVAKKIVAPQSQSVTVPNAESTVSDKASAPSSTTETSSQTSTNQEHDKELDQPVPFPSDPVVANLKVEESIVLLKEMSDPAPTAETISDNILPAENETTEPPAPVTIQEASEAVPVEDKSEAVPVEATSVKDESETVLIEATSVEATPEEDKSEAIPVEAASVEATLFEAKSEAVPVETIPVEASPVQDKSEAVPVEATPVEDESETVVVEATSVETTPEEDKFEAIPVEATSVEDESEAVLMEVAPVEATSVEATPIKDGSEVVPVEATPVKDESEAVPVKATPVKDESEAVPVEATPVKDESEAVPVEATPVKDESEAVPVEATAVMDESKAAPVKDESEAAPVEDESEAAPVEAAPVEAALVEAAPISEEPSIPQVIADLAASLTKSHVAAEPEITDRTPDSENKSSTVSSSPAAEISKEGSVFKADPSIMDFGQSSPEDADLYTTRS